MIAEYNSNSRQIQVRRMLDTMRIDAFMAEKGLTSEQAALTDMISTIDSMVPQCPPAFRSDANKISFLRQAIIKQPWATHAVTKVDAGDVTWRQFTTDLHAALSLRREIDPGSDIRTHVTEADIDRKARVFMTKYGRDPRYTRKHDYRDTRPPYNRPRQDRSLPERAEPVDRDSLSFEEARRLGLCKRCRNRVRPPGRDTSSGRSHRNSSRRTKYRRARFCSQRGTEPRSQRIFIRDAFSIGRFHLYRRRLSDQKTVPKPFSDRAKSFFKPGFLVDIGAPKSVIGKKALNRVFSASKTYQLPKLRYSPHSFRFANETFHSIGSLTLYLETPAGVATVAVDIDVVTADIPPLLGLDVIDHESLTPDVAFNVLAKRRREKTADGTPTFLRRAFYLAPDALHADAATEAAPPVFPSICGEALQPPPPFATGRHHSSYPEGTGRHHFPLRPVPTYSTWPDALPSVTRCRRSSL